MREFSLFDLSPAVYWLRGVFPLDLLALFVVLIFGFWTVAGFAWIVGAIGRRERMEGVLITGILVAGFVATIYVICKYL